MAPETVFCHNMDCAANGTFRSRLSALVRRGRALVRQRGTLEQAMLLVGAVSNFCDPHTSLRRVL